MEFIIFSSKDGVLAAFDLLWKRNKYRDARIWHDHMDCGGEYDFHAFKNYRDEHGIWWEVTVPGNQQINGEAERLGQTLHGMTSAMLKRSGFSMKY